MRFLSKLAALLLLSAQASFVYATSYVDFTAAAYTTVATNLQDTAEDGVTFALPIVLAVGALFVAVKLVKRVLNKVG